MTEDEKTDKKIDKKTDKKFDIPSALAASAALVVAVFASLGVSGGLLTMTARNNTLWIAIIVIGVLSIACLSTIAINRQRSKLILTLTVLAITAVLVNVVILGTLSLNEWEYQRAYL